MPAGDGLCTYEDQGLLPSRPIFSGEHPKELVERSQAWSWVLALEDDELLPELCLPIILSDVKCALRTEMRERQASGSRRVILANRHDIGTSPVVVPLDSGERYRRMDNP